jgi:outer membrane protein insertion porin family
VAEYDASRNAYFLSFTIDEGDRYSFGDISIETSIPGLNADALTGTIRTREGSRYSLADLEQTQADMAFEATQQGYPFADVRPRISRDITGHFFHVTYLVDEGPRVYVERIDIMGNEKTRDFVLRRELGFAEGDPFNRSMVTRAKTAIEALGYFDSVAIDLQPGSAADQVVIIIVVDEASTGDYGATVGRGFWARFRSPSVISSGGASTSGLRWARRPRAVPSISP